jgi:thiol-disulfide isomerase/thioredoxin
LILPEGEYYVQVQKDGYETATSLITKIDQQSVVTANVKMVKKLGITESVFGSFSRTDESNNFSLNVRPMPERTLIEVGKVVPDITFFDTEGNELHLLDKLSEKKPIVIFVYSSWNTLAQEQLNVYKEIESKYSDKYLFVPISTMEPDNLNITHLSRGDYGINFFKPDDKFYDDYFILSLPQVFVIDEGGVLKGIVVGLRSEEEFISRVDQLYETTEGVKYPEWFMSVTGRTL